MTPSPLFAGRFLSRLTSRCRRFAACEEGSGAVIEFVIFLPFLMFIFMAGAEAGLFTARQILLDRAVDLTMRDLGLGNIANPTHDTIKTSICDNVPSIPDCHANIRVELLPISTVVWNLPTNSSTCIDRGSEVQPALSFNPGIMNEMMLVRVCVMQDAIFPGYGMGKQMEEGSGGTGYPIRSNSAFVNEPT